VGKLRTIAQQAIGLMRGNNFDLGGFLAFEHRLVMFEVAVKFSRLTWEGCGPCPVFAFCTVSFAFQLSKKHGKTSVRLVKKCQLSNIQSVEIAAYCG